MYQSEVSNDLMSQTLQPQNKIKKELIVSFFVKKYKYVKIEDITPINNQVFLK